MSVSGDRREDAGAAARVKRPAPAGDEPGMNDPMPARAGSVAPPAFPGARMPDSPRERALLHRRAEALARVDTAEVNRGARIGYLRVRMGAGCFGIARGESEEVMYVAGMSPVPCTGDLIAGVASRHGQMIAVLDLKALFGIGAAPTDSESRIVVVRGNGMTVGLLVDAVEDEAVYHESELMPPLPIEDGLRPEFVRGIHQGTVTVLDVEGILSDPGIVVDDSE